tara:strand:- start:162 stop:713 length:552 start_codon:yes stop_codon:yes gene_type:complete
MKLLTEEMVQDALKQLGITEEQLEAGSSDLSSKIMEHYDCRISDRWEEQDLYIYEESTADGYSAYICTHNPNSICISEDVYQYDHNTEVLTRFEDAIRNGQSVYCDDEDFIEQVCDNMIDTFLDDVRADVEMEFHNKGYVWPLKIPALLKEVRDILTADNAVANPETIKRIDIALDQLTKAAD